MVEPSFILPTTGVWLRQAILPITLFLRYFQMSVNVHLSSPKAADQLWVKLFNLAPLSPAQAFRAVSEAFHCRRVSNLSSSR